ncbi:MAG: hypothetical protein P1V35_05700 [Planctomycetota bacterium]|nr:hypothetical protein [Planctomycetota bacterium]
MSSLKKLSAMQYMIALCLVGACVLGWLGWQQHQRVGHLRDLLAIDGSDNISPSKDSRLELQVEEIQTKARLYSDLHKQLEGEDLRVSEDSASYIRGIASNRQIALGSVAVNPSARGVKSLKGYTDRMYAILPKNLGSGKKKAPTFQRTQIANFMFKLEEGSKRVKVTKFTIGTDKPLKPEAIPDDKWTFRCSMTIRGKTE